MNVFGEKIVAMDETGRGATLALAQVGSVFAKNYKLEERSLEDAFYDIHENKNPAWTSRNFLCKKTMRTKRSKS